MLNITIAEIKSILGKRWFKLEGFLVFNLITIAIGAWFLSSIKVDSKVYITLIPLCCCSTIVWHRLKRCPKISKGKLGFVVSIAFTEGVDGSKIREDFIIPLQKLIKDGKTGPIFQFVEIPQHIANEILNEEDALRLKIKSRGIFVLYGRVRSRDFSGKLHNVFDLEGLVGHGPIIEANRKQLSNEFRELLPRHVRIGPENEMDEFQFTSEWAETVAKYIIGITAICSGDLNHGEALFKDIESHLQGHYREGQGVDVYEKLKQRLPFRFGEIHQARMDFAYDKWKNSRRDEDLNWVGYHIDKMSEIKNINNRNLETMKAIFIFLKQRDAAHAINILKKIKPDQDNTNKLNRMSLPEGITYCK